MGPVVRPDLHAHRQHDRRRPASYGLGVGVRWDFAPGGFVRFGYDERWLDIENANGTPDFGSFRLEVGGKSEVN